MRPLPSSRVCIGYEERKGVLLCLEDAILMEADTAAGLWRCIEPEKGVRRIDIRTNRCSLHLAHYCGPQFLCIKRGNNR